MFPIIGTWEAELLAPRRFLKNAVISRSYPFSHSECGGGSLRVLATQ